MIRALEMRLSLHSSADLRNISGAHSSSRKAAAHSSSGIAKTTNLCRQPGSVNLLVDRVSDGHSENLRSRRQVLSGLLLYSTAFYLEQCQDSQKVLAEGEAKMEAAGAVQTEQSVFEGLKSLFDPNEITKSGKKLPKAYLKSARGVVTKLRDSFNGDSKNESEFRRNADSAKEAIRDYVANWRGSKDVASEESYQALEKALRVLGEFYSKQGPRAALPEDVRARVLESLQTADDNL